MSKTYPVKTFPQDKNVFTSQLIPDTLIDEIRIVVNSGEYGKLEELLNKYPVTLNFSENKLTTSLLHNVIKSTITNTQKIRLVELLITLCSKLVVNLFSLKFNITGYLFNNSSNFPYSPELTIFLISSIRISGII